MSPSWDRPATLLSAKQAPPDSETSPSRWVEGRTSSSVSQCSSCGSPVIVFSGIQLTRCYSNSYAVNPSAWNWAGKTAFLYAGTCALGIIWSWFRLPEFKDRSYYELDILFARKVKARKFKGTLVEVNADEQIRAAQVPL